MIELRNGRVALALHTLRAAEGVALLLLHRLGGSAAEFHRPSLSWSGPIHALDFSGHGHSGRVYGGGYYPELWAADADSALAVLGNVVVLGTGLGAYVALLLAGARPSHVRCAVLCPGAGLAGGGSVPRFPPEVLPPEIDATARAQGLQKQSATDPAALAGQDLYVRPPEYAARFAAAARRIVLLEDDEPRPGWWRAARDAPAAARCHGPLEAALVMAHAEP